MDSLIGRDPATGRGQEVLFEGGFIVDIRQHQRYCPQWLSAGLIDLQVNGFAGYDFNDMQLSPERVLAVAKLLLSHGVTTFLPTIITASEKQIRHSLQTVCQARQQYPLLAEMIPAVHLEGPYISPKDGPRGAHPLEHVRAPDIQEFNRWQQCCGSLIALVTLSPHWPGANDFIARLCEQGVAVALGHTDADHQQVAAAVEAGACLSTHLGNGAAAELPRHPNLLWSQLAEDRLCATFIADGHHLPAETLKVMLRAKGLERSILVSDVVAAGGLTPGVYQQAVGGSVLLSDDGRLSIAGTPYLAGAAKPLSECVAHVITAAEISLSQALSLVTENAAPFVGRSGRLAVGERADLISFGWQAGAFQLQVRAAVVNGEREV